MARDIAAVWILLAKLRAAGPISVGGLAEDPTVDIACARDGLGRLYIPGSSLAGVLRECVRRRHGDECAARLFGLQCAEEGWASYLSVADSPVEGGATFEVRDGIAIDRQGGSAATDFLFTRQVLPAGTLLGLRVEVEVPPQSTHGGKRLSPGQTERVVRDLAATIGADGLTVGGGVSRGLGRLVVDGSPTLRKLDLAHLEHLQTWWLLRAGREPDEWPEASRVEPEHIEALDTVGDRWAFQIGWRPSGPVLVAAGAPGTEVDVLPLACHDGERYRCVIPGSSTKGVLRAHAERIVRTLCAEEKALPEDFKSQVEPGRATSYGFLIRDLFGQARGSHGGWAKGAVTVRDCLHRSAVGEDARRWTPGNASCWPGFHVRTRVSVDRWTGGALESALFRTLEPPWEEGSGGWNPLEIEVDLTRIPSDQRRGQAMALLWLVLRDLAEGRVGLGFGSTQGFGAVEVTEIAVDQNGAELAAVQVVKRDDGQSPTLEGVSGALEARLSQWAEGWRELWQ